MGVFRVILNRVFPAAGNESRGGSVLPAVALAAIVGLMWFVLAFLCLVHSVRSEERVRSLDATNASAKESGSVLSAPVTSAVIACVLSLTAWVALYWNDAIFFSRSLPWIGPLIRAQDPGFYTASRFFPCRKEGFDTGCEAYKWIPTFLTADALAYFPFVLIGLACYRNFRRVQAILVAVARQFIHWSVPILIATLCTRLVMHSLGFEWWDFQYSPTRWHSSLWMLIGATTGIVIVISGFLVPFYLYRAFRADGGLNVTRRRLSELTALTTLILAALMLGGLY